LLGYGDFADQLMETLGYVKSIHSTLAAETHRSI
jgi:hypothetical protein